MKLVSGTTEIYDARSTRIAKARILSIFIICLAAISLSTLWRINSAFSSAGNGLENSTIALRDHCAHTSPIKASEYHQRQKTLANLLLKHNASAYIAEPGASTAFFGNISQTTWRLSERPLLLMITPSTVGGVSGANILILTPKFEATRAKMLPVPANVRYIEWPEDANPYKFVATALSTTSGTIFLDKSIRKFIFDGLRLALPDAMILSAHSDINQLRERKSRAEIELLRCANEATVLAIRAIHNQLFIGIRESEARLMMIRALSAVGLDNGGCLTQFGENAALPHGSGTDRTLDFGDFALFDCTASLHGYYSDVTRTVALPDSRIPTEHLRIWDHVRLAQTMALRTARVGMIARDVDKAARASLTTSGYAQYFTHRLGHGIGLEVHEEPYLHGGNDAVIQNGNTFSDEPGVYVDGRIGVRLEDCFFIDSDGAPYLLTEKVGGQAASPWAP